MEKRGKGEKERKNNKKRLSLPFIRLSISPFLLVGLAE